MTGICSVIDARFFFAAFRCGEHAVAICVTVAAIDRNACGELILPDDAVFGGQARFEAAKVGVGGVGVFGCGDPVRPAGQFALGGRGAIAELHFEGARCQDFRFAELHVDVERLACELFEFAFAEHQAAEIDAVRIKVAKPAALAFFGHAMKAFRTIEMRATALICVGFFDLRGLADARDAFDL